MMQIRFLEQDDPLRADERELRYRVLREPLGFSRADVLVEGEERSMHVVAIEHGRVVGCVMLTPKSPKRGKLRQMAVDTTMQKTGLGRRLVEHLERELRARGFEEIELNARDYAVGFYEKLGYACEGEPFVEIGIPHRLMTKRL